MELFIAGFLLGCCVGMILAVLLAIKMEVWRADSGDTGDR